ncbi:MAG TPA: RluA family pseudouridine synthase [Thermoanaerobaculia bacterium]|nr:RluA family pseudouridine synthase [Thermoanaerobaculia bacterium]
MSEPRDLRHATVGDDQQDLRLDRALGELFPSESRNFLAKLISNGKVSIDGTPAKKPSQRVEAGQAITVEVPAAAPSSLPSQDLPLTILHQDEDVVVIDKPAGLVVHPAAGHPDQTLVNALLHHVQDLSGIGGELRPGIVHRLDKDTSGVMLIAKNDDAHRKLTAAWNTDAVRKEYLALVYGTPSEDRGIVDAPIGRDPRDRKRMAIVEGGRRAITEYELVERLRHASLLRCRLHTGRTHQIRVHMKHLGHPIVGDPVYSGPRWRGIPDRKIQRVIESLHRQALHAARITFPHPRDGRVMTIESSLPEDLLEVIQALRPSGAMGSQPVEPEPTG